MEARSGTVPSSTGRYRTGQPDRRWWILAVLCLSVLLVVVDNTIVNVALPTVSRDLHASTSALQWVVDAYTLSFAGLLLLGGNLGDRLGRRRFLQLGLLLFAATSVGAALSSSTGELIAARALMGGAAALVYPATLAILNNVFTVARERAIAIGVWSARVAASPSRSGRCPAARCFGTSPGRRCSTCPCPSPCSRCCLAGCCCRSRATPTPGASTRSARCCPPPGSPCLPGRSSRRRSTAGDRW